MAARRLIVVLLVLFGISVAAAAIAPDRRGPFSAEETSSSTSTTESTTTAPEEAPPPQSDEVVTARIVADAAKPETVRARPGDQLELTVDTPRALQVEIEPFGLLEEATPDAPAAFNVLLREAGAVPITDAEGGEIIGRIVIGDDGGGERPPAKREPDKGDPKEKQNGKRAPQETV